ncbi:uncharacterized protein LOC124947018 [Vespa velutina]|uniref:uncharacterized protein LOC124947018 n=1 Tax=Vespa velutina TaxID=202808 RepID=UPI001FB3D4C0|nr:uncharacterized protein LOC124947018 [Vespa velutina]XP_047344540.1 uncharacterized protein LOC124947018 [Vespa velutina]
MWGQGRRIEREFLLIALQFFGSICTSKLQDLTIDNQLVIVANDCYTRVSIGTKLPDKDIFFTIKVNTISDCEEECSKRRSSCVAFGYGISPKGNTSCELSSKMPNPEDLQTNSDYDVYLRTERLPNCEPDRLYKTGNSGNQKSMNNTRTNSRFSGGLFGSFLPNIYQPNRSENNGKRQNTSQQSYLSSFDDEQRIIDIIRNKNYGSRPKIPINDQKYPTFGINNESKLPTDKKPQFLGNNFGEKISFEKGYEDIFHFDRPIITKDDVYRPVTLIYRPAYDNVWQNKDFQNYGNKPINEIYSKPVTNIYEECKKTLSNFPNDNNKKDSYKTDKDNGMIVKNYQTYRTTTVIPMNEHNYQVPVRWKPIQNGITQQFRRNQTRPFVINSNEDVPMGTNDYQNFMNDYNKKFHVPINEENKSCYRRLLTGKKTVQVYVRRAIECQRLDECHRACDYEKYFVCEGFNYRRMGPGSRGMCEMTSVPYSRLNIHRDFQTDPQCDYYEKDPDCLRDTISQPSWPGPYPSGSGHTYIPDRRPSSDIPRPIIHHDQRPIYQKTDPARPIDLPRPQIDIRSQVYGGPYETHGDPFFQQTHSPHGRPIDNFNGNGYSYGRPLFPRPMYHGPIDRPYLPKYPDRRVDYNGPYNDIGTNEIGPYSSDRRKDPKDWQVYGNGIYGSSYGYDTNYVGHFDIPKYYPKNPIDVKPTRPQENDHFYGEFYNYGGAFGYGDNYIPADRDQLYGGTKKERRCTVRAGAGFKLVRDVIRKTYLTPNLEECESLCLNENNFLCMTLAYRYNVAATDPTDNCLLTEISYRDLNFYTDIEPNRDYDIYAIIGDPKTCDMMAQRHHHYQNHHHQNHHHQNRHPPDECFWRVRSGFGMPSDVIRKSIFVDDLGECQVECTVSREFTCRSFAFRYGLGGLPQRNPSMNCHLSDWPTQEINPTTMPDMDGAEIYERGSFGRGCEPYPFPPFKIGGQSKFPRGEDVCYSSYHKPCRLTPYSVMLAINVDSESECREKCSKMRQKDPIPCMSFSYKIRADRDDQNCLLSDVSIRDLRPGLDYAYDDDHVLYAWKDLEPQCMITGYSIDDNHVFGNQGNGNGKPLLPSPTARPDLGPGSDQSDGIYIPDPRPFYGHDISRPFNSVYQHGLRPYDPDRPDPPVRPTDDRPYRPHGGHGDYEGDYGYMEHNNFHGSNGQDDTFPPSPDFATFQHYTVNGYPCKRDTKCERNDVAGFWSCETEGGEVGSWDYCCEPNHHCGYSQGFHYPWCYVGLSDDQWRPCSEKYYPYLPSPRPIQQDVYHNHHHHHHYGDYNGDDHGDRNDINYYSRHWPVTYLHREPPPNCTDSLASANDKKDHLFNGSSIVRSNNDNSQNGDRTVRFQNHDARRRLVSRTADIRNKNRYDDKEHNGQLFFTMEKIGTKRFTTDDDTERNAGNIERTFKLNSSLARFNSTAIEAPFVTKQRGRNHSEWSIKMVTPLPPSVITNNERYKEFSALKSSNNFTSIFSGTNESNISELIGTTHGFIVKVN